MNPQSTMDRSADTGGSGDSLVAESYPAELSPQCVRMMKALIRMPASVDSRAHSLWRRVNAEEGTPTAPLKETEVLWFLSHVMDHAVDREQGVEAGKILSAYEYLNDLKDTPSRKRFLPAAPPSEWEWKHLDHLCIDFDTNDLSGFGQNVRLNEPAKNFLEKNRNLSYATLVDRKFLSKECTQFERLAWFVHHQPAAENHVDDMVYNLMSAIFGSPYIVKRQLDLPLHMSQRMDAPDKPKTAIVDVILLQIVNAKLRYGVIVVEDKSKKASAENATAQMVADAIAAAQTEPNRWIYMLLVKGNIFSFYVAYFDEHFLSDVKVGRRRSDKFWIHKGVREEEESTGLVGNGVVAGDYDIFIEEEREIIVQTLNRIRDEMETTE